MEVTGAEVCAERRRGQRRGGRFGGTQHRRRVRMIGDDDLLRPWLCLSLHEHCCKAVLDGGVDVSQAGLRVFGFLNGPFRFEVGALRRRAGGSQ